MMNEKQILTLITFIIPLFLLGQQCDTISYQKIYYLKGALSVNAFKIVADASGNIYMASNPSFPLDGEKNNGQAMVSKVNSKGIVLWTKIFGSFNYDHITDIAVTADGVVVGGTVKNFPYFDHKGWVAKLDASGNVQWSVHLDVQSFNSLYLTPLNNNDIAILGSYALDYTKDGLGNIVDAKDSRLIVARISEGGNVKWLQSYFLPNEKVSSGIEVRELPNGNFLLSGVTSIDFAQKRSFIMSLDANTGNSIWAYEYPRTGRFATFQIFPDNSFKMFVDNKIYGINSSGKCIFAKSCQLPDGFTSIAPLQNTGLPLISNDIFYCLENVGANRQLYIFKVEDFSTLKWSYTYKTHTDIGPVDYNNAMIGNNKIFINGRVKTKQFSSNIPSRIDEWQSYLIQANINGETPCAVPANLSVSFSDIDQNVFKPMVFSSHVLKTEEKNHVYEQWVTMREKVDCFSVNCCFTNVSYSDTVLCKGNQFILPDGSSTGVGGTYNSFFTNSNGCDSIVVTTITEKEFPFFSLGNDTCLLQPSITFKLPFGMKYIWQDASTDSVYTINSAGSYWVKAISECGVIIDTVIVKKECLSPIWVPNAFTPNKDGLNDIFRISNMNQQQLLDFSIYNRNGNIVFTTTSVNQGWDGTIRGAVQASGVYLYIIRFKDTGGNNHLKKGSFILIR